MTSDNPDIRIAFFGTPQIAVWVLEELERANVIPALIVTNPDTPQGRKMLVTETPVALWAHKHNIHLIKPDSLRDESVVQMLRESGCNLFLVAAYGKIIPQSILDIPKHGTLNVHPSLLPRLRGPSPIRTAILEDENPTGVSIMELTEGVDEGPILAQEIIEIPNEKWPMRGEELDELLARRGGEMLASMIPDWIAGLVERESQDHTEATYSRKITKDMGEIDFSHNPYHNLLKIRALEGNPGTYFYTERGDKRIRVKIVDAELAPDGALRITRVIPEGKKEMSYTDFIKDAK